MIIKALLVLGIAAFVIDYVGYVTNFHHGPSLVNLLIGVILAVVLLRMLMKVRRRWTRSRYR